MARVISGRTEDPRGGWKLQGIGTMERTLIAAEHSCTACTHTYRKVHESAAAADRASGPCENTGKVLIRSVLVPCLRSVLVPCLANHSA